MSAARSLGARVIAGLHVEEHLVGDAGEEAVPLLIALHGRGGVPGLPFASAIAPCRVLVPRGPVALGDGFAWSPRYAREGEPEALARDLAAVAERLAIVARTVREERGARGATIALGFSQGAMAALALAARSEAAVGDVVIGAAWLPPSLERGLYEKSGLRVRMAHGTADDVVPCAWARALSERMREGGVDVELRTFAGVDHASAPAMDALLGAWRDAAIARACGLDEPAIAGPPSARAGATRRSRFARWLASLRSGRG